MLGIEIIGDAKNFRMDGRLIRDVIGCARVDISKLTDDETKVEIKLFKPVCHRDSTGHQMPGYDPHAKRGHTRAKSGRTRAKSGRRSPANGQLGVNGQTSPLQGAASKLEAVQAISTTSRTSSNMSATSDASELTVAKRKVRQPKPRPSAAVFDEEELAEPSEEVIGTIHATIKRSLQESSEDVEGLGSAVNEVWQSDVDAFMYDEVAEKLDALVAENDDRQNRNTQLNQLWTELDWNCSGLVSMAAIDKMIGKKFGGVLQNIDTLILVRCGGGSNGFNA